MDAQRRSNARIELAALDQIDKGASDKTRELPESRFLSALTFERDVIYVDDHPGP